MVCASRAHDHGLLALKVCYWKFTNVIGSLIVVHSLVKQDQGRVSLDGELFLSFQWLNSIG